MSLWLVVVIVGAASAAFVYRQAQIQAKVLLDDQLIQIAGFAVSQSVRMPRNRSDDESIEVAVWDANGRETLASTPLLKPEMGLKPGFSRVMLGSASYRLYSTISNGRRIEVAQPMDTRQDVAEGAALSALLPVVLLLPVLAVVIALVIRALLQPVREAAAAVSRRDALASGALPTDRLPAEIVPLVEEINRLLQRQSDAVDRERQFIADAAHALRTPLTALQLQSDVLDGASTEAQRSARLAELREGIRRTSRLSSQLLSLARHSINTGEEWTDVDLACRTVAETIEPLMREKQVRLSLPDSTGLRCVGSTDQIGVVIGNLLDNAVRYTPPGSEIQVTVSVVDSQVELEVADTGPGLPTAELDKVFARFYRAPGDRTEGSGLGLSIVRSIVQALGGSVRLANRADGGLAACVRLPRA